MTEDDARWLAGVFDSRGSAYFVDYAYNDKMRGKRQRRCLWVVFMTHQRPDLLEKIRATTQFGYCADIQRCEKTPLFTQAKQRKTFSLSNAQARNFLTKISPFLRCKREAVLELLKTDAMLVTAKS